MRLLDMKDDIIPVLLAHRLYKLLGVIGNITALAGYSVLGVFIFYLKSH